MDSLGLFIRQGLFPWELNNILQIWNFVDDLPEGKEHNSAICALEMALLDLLGKLQGRSLRWTGAWRRDKPGSFDEAE